MSHPFNATIIREYDIRGIVDKTLFREDATTLGKAFGTMIKRSGGSSIAVGYDGRSHSPDFEKNLIEGLRTTGLSVEAIGLGPTPMLYYAVYEGHLSAGIMVTGSHNPSDQNGFKMLMSKELPGGGPIYGDAIKKLATMASHDDFDRSATPGTVSSVDLSSAYIDRVLKDCQSDPALTIVWDCGNGATGEIVTRLTARLPGRHILLFADIDGTFPNHHPDPTVIENLVDLKRKVAETKADLGIAFDGDGDRIGAIDSQGRIVAGDQLLAIFAADLLKRNTGSTIIADVKASQALFDFIKTQGGKPLMWKTGHSLIKAKMAETKAPLAGEMSGHIFFADTYYGYDDAIYAALRLITILSQSKQSLAEWRDKLPTTFVTPELRFPVDELQKFKIVDEIKKRLEKSGQSFSAVDGVRVTTSDGWWLLRASNTQAVLVARAESFKAEGLNRLLRSLNDHLKESGLDLPEKAEAFH